MIARLPVCDAPATARIEAYSAVAGRGLHGSLDAAAYVCSAHVQAARQAITLAGMTPYQVHGVSDGRTCGHVFDYTTMTLARAGAR